MVISAFLQSPADGVGKRRKLRRKLQLEVPGARADGDGFLVRIHNISQSGMLIECDAPLETGDVFDVELPHAGAVAVKVIWAGGAFFGCEFGSPISPAAVSAAELRGLALPAREDDLAPQDSGFEVSNTVEVHDPSNRFGANLRRLRVARGISQATLAAELDVSAPSVSGWEKGRARPKPDRMTALASLLGVPVTQLLVDVAAEPFEDLIHQGRERIARATGASPDRIRIFIEV